MEKPVKPNFEDIISNFSSLDYIVLSCMHYTDLKVMIKINALDLVESCEKFFVNHNTASGLSCLFDKGIYLFIFFSDFISKTFLVKTRGLLMSAEDASISSLVN